MTVRVLLFFLLLNACSTGTTKMDTDKQTTATPPKSLWTLWNFKSTTDPIGVKKGTYIKLATDSYSLYAGCNYIGGGLTVKGDSIKFMSGMSTLMACSDMEYEDKMTQLLLNVATYQLTENQLKLTTKDKKELVFEAQTPTQHLVGRRFKVAGLTIKGGVTYTDDAPLQTLEFGKDSTLSGSAGCNNYRTNYKIEADKLTIGMVVTTRMACLDAKKQEYETVFLQHFAKQLLTIEDTPNQITLRDSAGSTVMTLVEF